MGYAGWFCKRTERTAPKKDGCGLFYKRDAFELIARRDVQFNDLAVSHLGPGERARRARAREAAEERDPDPVSSGARAGNDGTGPSEPSETLDPLRNAATLSDSDSDSGLESVPPPEEEDARFVRDCVATMALLVAKEKETGDEKWKGRPVLVASAHLFWDPAYADVKLAQAERLLAEAADFLRAEAEAEGGRLSGRASDDESTLASSSTRARARLVADSTPLVVAGDFNSVPGSDVHARALRGVLLPRAEEFFAAEGAGAEARVQSLRYRSPRYRSLRSAYADAMASGSVSSAGLRPGETAVGFRQGGSPGGEGSDPSRGSPLEPAHTTVTPGFTDCIDYVFVSEDVEVLGAEAIPGAGGALAAGLPNANRPSDHLPVTVRLAF
jgi:CCR4-NOT transcription complex subunit 6